MKYYLLVLFFQIMFNIFKVLEIKFTYENRLSNLLLNSVWINLVSLASVYYSLDRLFVGDFWVLPFYISGSVIGKWIAMTQFENQRFKIFKSIFYTNEKSRKTRRTIKPQLQISSIFWYRFGVNYYLFSINKLVCIGSKESGNK